MSVAFEVDQRGVLELQHRLHALGTSDYSPLLEGIGGIVESQTRRRLQEEKTSPDGRQWKPWSEKYAGKKHGPKGHEPHPGQLTSAGGHTLLSLFGHLNDSLQHLVTFNEVEVGSNLKYARRQNEARPFLGIGSNNESELLGIVEDYLAEKLAKA